MLGFTMIEMLAALALAAIMVAGVAVMTNSMLEDTRAQQAALYQSQLTAAATQLIQQNYSALAAAATTSTPVVASLSGSAYQMSTYTSSAMNNVNAYGQTPCLLIYGTSTAGALQALLVTEGGTTIPDAQLGFIAANAGSGGGSIQAMNNAGGAANGAFGSWAVASPNPAGASCSGTKTGVGHVASLIYYNGTQAQNADYLYRIAVPGDTTANTMQVPIVLAKQAVSQDYQACSQLGAITADAAGNVVVCQPGPASTDQWVPQAAYHWREPVADYASLASVSSPGEGDVRMTLATHRAYTYVASTSTWQALAVDEAGNLALGNAQTIGAACSNAASTTLVSTDSTGRVLSCQNGIWQTQSEIEPASQLTGCQLVMSGAGAGDYPSCTAQSSANYTASPYSYNAANGTYSYVFSQQVTMTKPGIIVAASWAHLNDGLCGSKPGHQAQLSQDVDILDSNKNNVAHTESQSPTLTDDSGGINNALAQSGAAGTYYVVVTTNWATYSVISTPWTSSFCGQSSQTIPNTPVAAGWTINSYY
ncbi:shufflon system plasmid conjugative transfer pilus tip adhesin PilV [Trinickia terrae]|uniref:Shufflon system plasmid conjugative transfer pilus tip adhesin PilV n=2 Tax=Trinickia terrae TaxID=2571161 RepID=A0A4U1I1H3_9BURK|nr:shufflon system plasmid conjugative transfer pilus tip adhesin PilV [Trinickia terrae]